MSTHRNLPPGIYREMKHGKQVYRARIVCPGGPDRKFTFSDPNAALEYRIRAQAAADRGEPLPPTKGPAQSSTGGPWMPLSKLGAHFEAQRLSDKVMPGTIQSHRKAVNALVAALGDASLAELEHAAIQKAFADFDTRWERSTCVRRLALLRAMLDLAVKNRWIPNNPATDVKILRARTKASAHISPPDLLQLLAAVKAESRVGVALQGLCGLRVGELFGIQINDIDLGARTIRLTRQGGRPPSDGADEQGYLPRTKTTAGTRTIGLPKQVFELLLWHMEHVLGDNYGPESRLMTRMSSSWTYNWYQKDVTRAAEVVGMLESSGKPITTHWLRKFGISFMLDAGIPLRIVSIVCGHEVEAQGASRMTTGVYDQKMDIARYAKKQSQMLEKFVKKRIGTTLIIPNTLDRAQWATLLEAAEQLGVSEGTVRALGNSGELIMTTIHFPGDRHPKTILRRDRLTQYVEAVNNWVSVRDVSAQFGYPQPVVRRVAIAIGALDSTRGARPSILVERVSDLGEALTVCDEFAITHISLAEAARRLNAKPASVSMRLASQHLDFVEPPPGWAGGPGQWLKRSWLADLGDSGPEELLTIAQASLLIGISAVQTRRLMGAGLLATKPGKRKGSRLIERNSAVQYRDRDRRSAWAAARTNHLAG